MSEITVAPGWQHILDEAVEEASRLPPEWHLVIVDAPRVSGGMELWGSYLRSASHSDQPKSPRKRAFFFFADVS